MEEPASSQVIVVDPGSSERDPGHRPTFHDVYLAESSYLWNALRRFGVREGDLEDLLHDAFVKVHHALHRYDPSRPLRPWLCGIAFRVASDYRRRARVQRERLSEELDREQDRRPLPDEELAREQARALLLRGLESMDLDRRAVLVMHDIDGFSVPEIAQALGLRLNTAYSRLRIARRELAAAVRRIQLERGAA
jgi:RNA polymerase sigma-70 factor (ECF subfamily)